ncbi:hypothetical protein ACFOU2_17655 [Bacillus songklensis]|uniref:Uncharacterized protein n=1 Tax=Bacillus songklensis TaxID=1069116 RepID=A0ABV8B767_9BACI
MSPFSFILWQKYKLHVEIVQLHEPAPTVIFEEQEVQASMLVTGRDRS